MTKAIEALKDIIAQWEAGRLLGDAEETQHWLQWMSEKCTMEEAQAAAEFAKKAYANKEENKMTKDEALKLAIQHIEHMAAWIKGQNELAHQTLYSFEGLSEDMPSIKAALEEPVKPDYVYNPEDWEVTYPFSDRSQCFEDAVEIGEVKVFSTLVDGPDLYVTRVKDEDGYFTEQEFPTMEEAQAAAEFAKKVKANEEESDED